MRKLSSLLLVLWLGCGGAQPATKAERYKYQQNEKTLAALETADGIELGEFPLADKAVLDGDTIRVSGLDNSLRLLGLDAEETFKKNADRRDAEIDFDAYLKKSRGPSDHPVKAATPMGEEAKNFAKHFFEGVTTVRIERDHAKEIRDLYGRYLAYLFVEKDGKWLNYNVECVRAGMSPYFTKYGYSRRFHPDFAAAEKEAREKKVGIWNPNSQAYRDYDERKVWWDARAEFIRSFEAATVEGERVVLTHWDAMRRLESLVGKRATILGAIQDIRLGDKGPTRVLLSRRMFSNFPVVFFDKDVFMSSGIADHRGEFVAVTGVVNVYENKRTGHKEMQLIVDLPSEVQTRRTQ